MSSFITIDNLSFSWSAQASSWIHGLSLRLEPGHVYGLMGRNGAGKTTLLRLISGCLAPLAGSIRAHVGGQTYEAFDRDPQMLSEIVLVAENSELPALTVTEFGTLAGRLYPRFQEARFHENLRALDVLPSGKLSRLSFGQRRKAHVAFALATEASLVLLDEPTNGLDIAAQIALRRLLIEHVSEQRSLLVSTHHVREFENVVDRVIVLEGGRVVANEAVDELQTAPGYGDLESWYARLIGVSSASTKSRAASHAEV